MECFINIWLTVLAMLTTALIGWQIFAVIDLNKRVEKKIKKHLKTLKDEQAIALRKTKCEAIGATMYNIGDYQLKAQQYAEAFSSYLKALDNLYKEDPSSVEVELCFNRLGAVVEAIGSSGDELLLPDYVRDR